MGASSGADALLTVRELQIDRPDGQTLLEGVNLELRPGEVVALLGSSGGGKSTLMLALHDRPRLEGFGFGVKAELVEVRSPIGIVPQRGALFDHLSIAGNVALAMRNADPPRPAGAEAIREALTHVDLPEEWAEPGHRTGHVSGGEAQRLAVARTLAGGRKVLFLDEPSVGLDPLRVHMLADLLREEIREREAAALVVTHDLIFAAGFADRFVYLDKERRTLVELDIDTMGDATRRSPLARRAIAETLADEVERRLGAEPAAKATGQRGTGLLSVVGDRLWGAVEGMAMLPRVAAASARAVTRPRDFLEVFGPVLKQALLRPALFFGVVSLLIGATLLYIFHRSLGGGELPVRADRVFGLIGSMHVIALTPALTGILFASTSANAVTAWLGSMSLTRQTDALRALGIPESRYLWFPAWLGLCLSFLVMAVIFAGGMVGGGVLYLQLRAPEIVDPFAVMTADLLDPPPGRLVFRTRMIWLVVLYAAGVAADAVAKGSREKSRAEDVTVSMVRSVMTATLWIVGIELLSLVFLYATVEPV